MTQRGRRRLLIGVLLGLGGLIAALLAGPLLLDHERYRGMLISRASQLLNRTVTAGSLRAHLLPSPGVTIRDVRVADHTPDSAPLLEAEQLNVALKLLPLLKGEIQVGDIRIDRPRIRLVRGPDGWNLNDVMLPIPRGGGGEPRRTERTRSAGGQPALPVLVTGALAIRQGTIVLENPFPPSGPARLELKDLNLDIPAAHPPNPIRIHASGTLPGKLSGSFDLSGSVQRAEADRMPIDVALQIQGVDAAQLASSLGLSHTLTGQLSGTLDLGGKAAGVWPVLELQVEADLRQVGLALPRPQHAGTGAKEAGKTPGDKAWLQAKGRWDGDALDLPEMSLSWKGQTTTGKLHVATQQSPRIQFWLNTPDLALEPLVALATATDPATGSSPAPHNANPAPLPSAPPPSPSPTEQKGQLQVEGHLRSGALRWGNLLLTNAEGDLRYCCGQLAIRQLQGSFYGGHLSGDAAFSFGKPAPRVKVTTHLEGVQIEPFLKALQEPQWTLRGVMTSDSTMELSGPFGPGTLAKLSAQTDMAVTNGRVIGYAPLERLTKTVDPMLKGVGIPPLTLNEFDRLSAHWTLDGGVLRTRDLTLLRNGTTFYVMGSANLLNQTLDLNVTAKIGRTTLEAKVQGPSSDPVVIPQAGSVEGRIKTEVGKLLGKDRQKELGKMLQQLFSR